MTKRRSWMVGAKRRSGRLFLSVAALVSACAESTRPPDPPEPLAATLEIGTASEGSASGFVPLEDGQDVELVPGAQGGFHVFIHVRLDAVSVPPDHTLYLDRSARREDTGQLVSQAKQRAELVPAEDPERLETSAPMLMFLCPAPVGIPVADEVLVVRVAALTLYAEVDVLAESALRIRPHCPEGEEQSFCRRICSG